VLAHETCDDLRGSLELPTRRILPLIVSQVHQQETTQTTFAVGSLDRLIQKRVEFIPPKHGSSSGLRDITWKLVDGTHHYDPEERIAELELEPPGWLGPPPFLQAPERLK
jgi:hypothetical protein